MKMATIREVKAKLSEYVQLARDDVIVITRHGRPVAHLSAAAPPITPLSLLFRANLFASSAPSRRRSMSVSAQSLSSPSLPFSLA